MPHFGAIWPPAIGPDVYQTTANRQLRLSRERSISRHSGDPRHPPEIPRASISMAIRPTPVKFAGEAQTPTGDPFSEKSPASKPWRFSGDFARNVSRQIADGLLLSRGMAVGRPGNMGPMVQIWQVTPNPPPGPFPPSYGAPIMGGNEVSASPIMTQERGAVSIFPNAYRACRMAARGPQSR